MHRVLRLVGAATLGLATVLLAGAAPSAASSYTLNFKGHVTSVAGAFDTQGFLPGDTISGTLTVDPFNATTIKDGPDPSVDRFNQAASSFTFHIANATSHQDLSDTGSGFIQSTSFGSDDLDFLFGGFGAPDTSTLNLHFSVFSGATALTSLAGLPGTAGGVVTYLGGLPLALSANGSFQTGLFQDDVVQFDLNLAATPISGALPLFVTALMGTGLLSWRRARRGA